MRATRQPPQPHSLLNSYQNANLGSSCYNNCMAIRSKTPVTKKSSVSGKFVLGRERFESISAVEGIKRTPAMKKRAKEFEKAGLSLAEQRREIMKLYRKKA